MSLLSHITHVTGTVRQTMVKNQQECIKILCTITSTCRSHRRKLTSTRLRVQMLCASLQRLLCFYPGRFRGSSPGDYFLKSIALGKGGHSVLPVQRRNYALAIQRCQIQKFSLLQSYPLAIVKSNERGTETLAHKATCASVQRDVTPLLVVRPHRFMRSMASRCR